jgi:hypothetical protein
MKATRTIELAKGVVITVVAEFCEYHTEGDAWEGRVAEHKAWVSTEITLEMNGKKFESVSGFTSDENYITKVLKLDDSIKAHSLFRDKTGKAIAINLKAENAEKVLAAIEEAKAEVITDEVKACKKAEAEAADKEERAEAQAVLEAAERVINNGSKLRTNAERKVWERNYNNAMNEGGEGYVPHYPSVEEYEAAKARLNR